MKPLKMICRVTVYADATLEAILLKQFLARGSTGDTVIPCRGKGEHDTVADPFAIVTRVQIELLVQPEVAHNILTYLDSPALKRHPVAACMDSAQVVQSVEYGFLTKGS